MWLDWVGSWALEPTEAGPALPTVIKVLVAGYSAARPEEKALN